VASRVNIRDTVGGSPRLLCNTTDTPSDVKPQSSLLSAGPDLLAAVLRAGPGTEQMRV